MLSLSLYRDPLPQPDQRLREVLRELAWHFAGASGYPTAEQSGEEMMTKMHQLLERAGALFRDFTIRPDTDLKLLIRIFIGKIGHVRLRDAMLAATEQKKYLLRDWETFSG